MIQHLTKSNLIRGFRQVYFRFKAPLVSRNPVSVFHHVPKCGGTSLRNALKNWFIVKYDYASPRNSSWELVNIENLRSLHCLAGHFASPGFHLADRYPEVFEDKNRFQLFTFIRDPLLLKLSLRRYEAKRKGQPLANLEEHLLGRENYLAGILNCDSEADYMAAVDRYDFVGILEWPNESIFLLADFLGKPRVNLPQMNQTKGGSEFDGVSSDLMKEFQRNNNLDYLIYEYALKKFKEIALRKGFQLRAL